MNLTAFMTHQLLVLDPDRVRLSAHEATDLHECHSGLSQPDERLYLVRIPKLRHQAASSRNFTAGTDTDTRAVDPMCADDEMMFRLTIDLTTFLMFRLFAVTGFLRSVLVVMTPPADRG